MKRTIVVMTNVNKEWTTFSIALFIAWAIVLLIRWKLMKGKNIKPALYVFYGFVIGWLTTTIKFLIINK